MQKLRSTRRETTTLGSPGAVRERAGWSWPTLGAALRRSAMDNASRGSSKSRRATAAMAPAAGPVIRFCAGITSRPARLRRLTPHATALYWFVTTAPTTIGVFGPVARSMCVAFASAFGGSRSPAVQRPPSMNRPMAFHLWTRVPVSGLAA